MCNLCLLTRTAKCSTHQLIAQKLDFSLIDKNWDQIMKGNRVYATENIDIYGARNTSSYVMLPVYASNQSSDKK